MRTPALPRKTLSGFILTREWRDGSGGINLEFWLATELGPVLWQVPAQEAVFFILADRLPEASVTLSGLAGLRLQKLKLRVLSGGAAAAVYGRNRRTLFNARDRLREIGIEVIEGDVRPTDRFLMERFICGSVQLIEPTLARLDAHLPGYSTVEPRARPGDYRPDFTVMSVDIETAWNEPRLYSIGLICGGTRHCYMVADGGNGREERTVRLEGGELIPCRSEREAILRWLALVDKTDPDLIIGWNLVQFDLRFLQDCCDRLEIDFRLGRNRSKPVWRWLDQTDRYLIHIPGRVALDGIELLRTLTWHFSSFSLETVAQELLGRGKLVTDVDDRAVEIQKMYQEDQLNLAAYNLEDCQLVLDIFAYTELIDFAWQRSRMTGLEMGRSGGAVAAFDFLYLPRLHRRGYVAPVPTGKEQPSPGGYVLGSQPGLYHQVVLLDFKSLYPSIIRTFHIDPLALYLGRDEPDAIEGFRGASFSRRNAILPLLLEHLWAAREQARCEGRAAMSQAIKILMNSFYGVMGAFGCRFFDPRLASSITLRGHDIIQRTRELLESEGYRVVYGDTDSVFVLLGEKVQDEQVPEIAGALVDRVNHFWQEQTAGLGLESFLQMEFETHFARFFMPTVRGSEQGSKKRYAGLAAGDNRGLVFKGLEAARSDWSPLARDFQRELYKRVFTDQPYQDYVRRLVAEVRAGKQDKKLVLRKRLRQRPEEYRKAVPPHVQAARKAEAERQRQGMAPRYRAGVWIEYCMTVCGAEPVRYRKSPLDYDFYVERQLAPIADTLLYFHDTSLKQLLDRQMDLFG